MLTETGTLPNGVEYGGQTHNDFEIREQIVADSIGVFDDPDRSAKAQANMPYANLCITAQMIISLGTIPKDAITPELLMGMLQSDMNEISLAEVRLKAKRESFRRPA